MCRLIQPGASRAGSPSTSTQQRYNAPQPLPCINGTPQAINQLYASLQPQISSTPPDVAAGTACHEHLPQPLVREELPPKYNLLALNFLLQEQRRQLHVHPMCLNTNTAQCTCSEQTERRADTVMHTQQALQRRWNAARHSAHVCSLKSSYFKPRPFLGAGTCTASNSAGVTACTCPTHRVAPWDRPPTPAHTPCHTSRSTIRKYSAL